MSGQLNKTCESLSCSINMVKNGKCSSKVLKAEQRTKLKIGFMEGYDVWSRENCSPNKKNSEAVININIILKCSINLNYLFLLFLAFYDFRSLVRSLAIRLSYILSYLTIHSFSLQLQNDLEMEHNQKFLAFLLISAKTNIYYQKQRKAGPYRF